MRDAEPPLRGRRRFGLGSGRSGAGSRVWVFVCAALLGAVVSGCSGSRAGDLTAGPPLAIPVPPPRVLPSVAEEVPLAASPASTNTTLAEPPEVVQDRADIAPKQPPVTTARPNPPPTSPAPASTANTPVSELPQQVRIETSRDEAVRRDEVLASIRKAESDLNRVDKPENLSKAARQQYDDVVNALRHARRFLDERNLELAEVQADKAAKIAADLAR